MAGHPVHVGCSGWNYRHWRGVIYPPGLAASRWLARYAELFDTVEVNSTFYRLASPRAVERWLSQTPPRFIFAVKASRYLTHLRRLVDIGPGIERFYAAIGPLAASPKLGPVLWQLPERFHRDDDRLARALALLPPGRHSFEFRHPSWFTPDVYALLRAHGVALTIADHPERPFQSHELTADWTFLRLHYGRADRGDYSSDELQAWGARIGAWRQTVEVFAYFNNDWQGFAPANALALRKLVERFQKP